MRTTTTTRALLLQAPPVVGLLCLAMVFCGLALGHSLVVVQDHLIGPLSAIDTVVSMGMGALGIALVWAGLRQPETPATLLGYLGGILIWCGIFEWTWRYFGHWLALEPVRDNDIPILMPGLQVIQVTSLIVVVLLVFLGANKDTRCRMFMWFHRNLGLRPGRMTPGYERQHARTTATETVFLIWFIYICAIAINDPRLIRYDSVAAMAITVGFVVWGLYLASKLMVIRGVGPTFRYAIPTGHILWLPIEAFSRWGLYPEIWIKPFEYDGLMLTVLLLFCLLAAAVFRAPRAEPLAA